MRLSPAFVAAIGLPCAMVAASAAAWAAADAPSGPSEPLFVTQIVLLLVVGRSLGEFMQRIGQPAIMGQLLAGILLGPSLLGALWPHAEHAIFPSGGSQKVMLDGVAQLGVLLLLLLTGMETELALIWRLRRAAASVSLAGIAAPFLCGVALGLSMPEAMLPSPQLRVITALFLGTALSISSVKIVAAVVRDMDAMRRTIGQLIVAAAIIDDTIGWIIISIIFGLARQGRVAVAPLCLSVLGTLTFLAFSFTIGQRLVSRAIRWSNDHFVSELPVITVILVIMGVMALMTALIGVHTVLGAFVAGILVGRSPILTEHVRNQLRGAIVALFMPVFFGIAGLGADLTVLRDPTLLLVAGGMIVIASVGKFGGAFVGGRIARLSARESLALGCGLNARGSTEVIIATIGLSMGALNQTLYTMIVAMAFVTTMVMPPMLRWALARLPISPEESERLAREAIEAKGFLGNLERLLVAVDDSANGRFAARLAGVLSAWRRIPTTVLELAEPAAAAAVLKDAAEAAPNAAEAAASGVDVTTRRRTASGAEAVAAEARKGYGLMITGVAGALGAHGAVSPALVALAGAFNGPLAVIDARGPHCDAPVASALDIMVPVTGTQESSRALEVALALARAGTAPLTLVYVAPKLGAGLQQFAASLRGGDGGLLKQAVDLAEHFQVATRIVVRRGMAVEEAILDQVSRGQHDLVVMGVRAHAGGTLFFGDVASQVMARSPASVMLVSG